MNGDATRFFNLWDLLWLLWSSSQSKVMQLWKYNLFSSCCSSWMTFFFLCREFTVETEGKTFTLTKDMVTVKRFQKTLHGKCFVVWSTDVRGRSGYALNVELISCRVLVVFVPWHRKNLKCYSLEICLKQLEKLHSAVGFHPQACCLVLFSNLFHRLHAIYYIPAALSAYLGVCKGVLEPTAVVMEELGRVHQLWEPQSPSPFQV